MKYKRNADPERLAIATVAIGNALDDPILRSRLEVQGYNEKRLRKGLGKIEKARQMYSTQVVGYGSRLAATGHVDQLHKSLRKQFVHDRNVVRLAIDPDPGLYEKLHVKGQVSRKKEVILHQMRHFYREVLANENVLDAVTIYSLTRPVLEERLNQVETFALAIQDQQHLHGESLILTRRKRQAMAELDDWMVQFLFVARRTFKYEPVHLEKLGVTR